MVRGDATGGPSPEAGCEAQGVQRVIRRGGMTYPVGARRALRTYTLGIGCKRVATFASAELCNPFAYREPRPMRYRVLKVPIWIDEDESRLTHRVADKLHVAPSSLKDLVLIRKSLDARKKGHLRWLVNVEVEVEGSLGVSLDEVQPAPEPEPPPAQVRSPALAPIILGAGPAGLFCAHALLERGVRSIVVDRGEPVAPRPLGVAKLMRSGELDGESNMNFGEGGAGAYTDGKLGTRVHHPAVRRVVELFARFGGVARILAEGKPHVGSDLLPGAVSAMREDLERGGCEFRWNALAVDIEVRAGRVQSLVLAD